jgi:N-acyl amino acid synthase of PEP-CTERM/exosortase system
MSFYAEATGAAATSLGLGMLSSLDLGREFRRAFTAVRASSEALRREAFAIRHAVYCDELRYEAPRPDGLEHDEFDLRAEHLLLDSVEQRRPIACARLIRASSLAGREPLPLELVCGATLGARWSNLSQSRRIAELSHLAVVREFRRRSGEDARDVSIGDADFGTASRPRFPYIPVGLCLAALALARRVDIDALVVLAEPQLALHLARLGIPLQQIGGPVQHHGTRVPYLMDVDVVAAGLRAYMRPLYDVIGQDLDAPAER